MAFDKKAYNRDYYLRNKDKWEAYRDENRGSTSGGFGGGGSRYSGTGRSNAAAMKSVYQKIAQQRYGAYGNTKAKEMKDKKNREHTINSSNAAIARRKQQEAAQNRYGQISRGAARDQYYNNLERTMLKGGLAESRRIRGLINEDKKKKEEEKRQYEAHTKELKRKYLLARQSNNPSGKHSKGGVRASKEYWEELEFNSKKNQYPEGMKAASSKTKSRKSSSKKRVSNFLKKLFG